MLRVPAILSFVNCPALRYLSTLSHKRYEDEKKVLDIIWFDGRSS
jgi:hypothetical protein